MISNADNFYDFDHILLLILVVFIGIAFLICVINSFSPEKEETCVDYYINNNGYILGTCKNYENKLKELPLGTD